MNSETTLWFGDTGTKLDKTGNVYTVYRVNADSEKRDNEEEIDIYRSFLSMYQSFLREIGFEVKVENNEVQDVIPPFTKKTRIIHQISTPQNGIYFCGRKSFGYGTTHKM